MTKKRQQRRCLTDFDGKLSEDAECLDRYLYQYRGCISKKQILERRKDEFKKEFSPVKSPNMDGMPRSSSVGEGIAVALVIRLDEIDEKIEEQMNRAAKLLSDILSIIELLPEGTSEESLVRSVIENKYIDRMSWGEICNENNLSLSSVKRYRKKGLYDLLEFEKVKKVIREFKEKEEKEDAAKKS